MSSEASASIQTVLVIFNLPTELITLMAKYLCDADLCVLTRVSHRIASIACPLYFARKGLILSSVTNTLSLRDEGFEALDIWRRSPGFSAMNRLACSFSFHPQRAIEQMKHLRKCFDSLPSSFFLHVRLTHIDAGCLEDILDLLRDTAFLTGCLNLTLSRVTYQDAPQPEHTSASHASRRCKKTSPADIVLLEPLQNLRLMSFNLTELQWSDFFSRLCIPSLRCLAIWGKSSVVAISSFLLRQPDIRELRFVGGSWMDFPPPSLQLRLPLLGALQGYSYEILFILKAISSPPVLYELVIETDPPAQVPQIPFVDQVFDILAICKGSFPLDIVLTNENMAELMLADARALAVSKLSPSTLPSVSSLRIGFHCMYEVIPVSFFVLLVLSFSLTLVSQACCELWMSLFPHLRQARLYTAESDMRFGTIFRRPNDIIDVVWGSMAS